MTMPSGLSAIAWLQPGQPGRRAAAAVDDGDLPADLLAVSLMWCPIRARHRSARCWRDRRSSCRSAASGRRSGRPNRSAARARLHVGHGVGHYRIVGRPHRTGQQPGNRRCHQQRTRRLPSRATLAIPASPDRALDLGCREHAACGLTGQSVGRLGRLGPTTALEDGRHGIACTASTHPIPVGRSMTRPSCSRSADVH